jgi:hypothetical protein
MTTVLLMLGAFVAYTIACRAGIGMAYGTADGMNANLLRTRSES